MTEVRVILIGGSSNVGKTTLAQSLADRLGWRCMSTDSLARHPGRPWRSQRGEVPAHVAEHYRSLDVDELLEDVLRHYRGMWPGIESLIRSHATDPSADRLVLEGSALWPESVATLDLEEVAAVWLTAGDDLFRERIHRLSDFDRAPEEARELVGKFLERTWAYNEAMKNAAARLGLDVIDVGTSSSVEALCAIVSRRAGVAAERSD